MMFQSRVYWMEGIIIYARSEKANLCLIVWIGVCFPIAFLF